MNPPDTLTAYPVSLTAPVGSFPVGAKFYATTPKHDTRPGRWNLWRGHRPDEGKNRHEVTGLLILSVHESKFANSHVPVLLHFTSPR